MYKEFNYWSGPCVYLLLSEGHVVYVGQTINLSSRVDAHHKDGRHKGTFDQVLYQPCKIADLNKKEISLIRRYKPSWNKRSGGHTRKKTTVRAYKQQKNRYSYDYKFRHNKLVRINHI